jgi:predicted site-specific integrase-resolvase
METREHTIPTFARNVGAAEITIRRRVLSGDIKATKILGKWRIPVEELSRFLQREAARSTAAKGTR